MPWGRRCCIVLYIFRCCKDIPLRCSQSQKDAVKEAGSFPDCVEQPASQKSDVWPGMTSLHTMLGITLSAAGLSLAMYCESLPGLFFCRTVSLCVVACCCRYNVPFLYIPTRCTLPRKSPCQLVKSFLYHSSARCSQSGSSQSARSLISSHS